MCPVDVGDEPRRTPLPVRPSAPLELLWLGHRLQSGIDEGDRIQRLGPREARELRGELQEFWGDGHSAGVGELVVIADALDQLFSESLDGLLPSLPPSDLDPSHMGLRAEDPGDRERFIERVGRLQRDPRLRRRYASLLVRVWEPFRQEWERQGLPQVLAAGRALSRRLEGGTPLREAAPVVEQLAAKRAPWGRLIEDAVEQERLVLVPAYFGGRWSLWDLPRHVVVGFNRAADPVADFRAAGRHVGARLKVLGDPTRLALLLFLADQPTSVGELASRFELAQPTVSAHLRALREASMVTNQRVGGRTVYRADRSEIKRLLSGLAENLGLDQGG